MKKTTITVGEIEAKACVFSDGKNGRWVTMADHIDYVEFDRRYTDGSDARFRWKQATPINMEGWEKRFFAVAVSDCFDPPVAIVRADNESQAIDLFVDELEWAHISDRDLEDYAIYGDPAETTEDGPQGYDEQVSFNSNGQAYDAESIVVWEVKLTRVEME